MAKEDKTLTAVADVVDVPEEGMIIDEATDEVLRLHLDMFEGPFEVLLYLIKVQEIDVFDIPIMKVTEQYLRFLELMREEDLDVTGEFLVMAATLIQIKSKMLLPPDEDPDDDEEFEEEDPRIELVEKLIMYRKFRDIAERFEFLERERQQWFARKVKTKVERDENEEEELLEVSLYDLVEAFRGVLRYFNEDLFHTVDGEGASVDEKIEFIEGHMAANGSLTWCELFEGCRSKVEMVCCFLAILELCRMGRLRAHQHSTFEDIRLFPAEREDND